MNYMTHLNVQGKTPKAICMDCGCEFVNETLFGWCQSKGMEMQMTAPYSPSQNSVAERMNRTLKELA
jgi:transposase InsO family protein